MEKKQNITQWYFIKKRGVKDVEAGLAFDLLMNVTQKHICKLSYEFLEEVDKVAGFLGDIAFNRKLEKGILEFKPKKRK